MEKLPSFLNQQVQGQYWKEEGVKAWNVKDYKRAIKLLNLSLQFPNSHDLSYLVNNYLAGAYFETKQYSKAVEKGRECFKLKPTKSQVRLTNSPSKNNCVRRWRTFSVFVSFSRFLVWYFPRVPPSILFEFQGFDGLANWLFASISCGRSLAMVVKDIPSYHALVLRAQSTEMFLSSQLELTSVHFSKVSSTM